MCNSCQALRVNGVLCYETGCPDSYKGSVRSCKWCGSKFEPYNKRQEFCGDACYADYFGLNLEPEPEEV